MKRGAVLSAAVGVVALAGTGLCGCASSGSAGSAPATTTLAEPLATSVQAGGTTWATLPMGYLDQPSNTFWQLFERPSGSDSWTDQVAATAVATNGGIVLAPSPNATLVAAVRPSNLLTYSPLVATADAGQTWSNGVLDAGLLDRPDALAAESATQALALAGPAGDPQLLETSAGLDTWRVVTDERAIASTAAGRSCRVGALGAVAYFHSAPIVGAACERAGVVGVLAETAGGWRLDGPVLSGPLAGGRAQVLGLWPSPTGMAALLGVTEGGRVELVGAFTADAVHWTLSPPTALGTGWKIASVGPADTSGLFVLSESAANQKRLELVAGPGAGWSVMPSPPSATSTVALDDPARPQALAVTPTVLTVWGLGSGSWSVVQRLNVPIQFGSSS